MIFPFVFRLIFLRKPLAARLSKGVGGRSKGSGRERAGKSHPGKKKSARELRQGRSDYRCCLPALAGFVCLQSAVPDGARTIGRGRSDDKRFPEKIAKPLAFDFWDGLKVPHQRPSAVRRFSLYETPTSSHIPRLSWLKSF